MNLLRKFINFVFLFSDLFVFLINLIIITVSLWLAFFVTHGIGFVIEKCNQKGYIYCLIIIIFIKFLFYYIFKTFHGIWRYVSLNDLARLFFANFFASLTIYLLAVYFLLNYLRLLNTRVTICDFLLCLFFSSGVRVFVRMFREFIYKNKTALGRNIYSKKALIVGELNFCDSLIHSLSHHHVNRDIVGILIDEPVVGRSIRNIPIYNSIDIIGKLVDALGVDEILLLPPYSSPVTINRIMSLLERAKVKCFLRMVPAYSDIAAGNIDISLIKNVGIGDLLERFPIKFDDSHVINTIKGKRVMITGGGGSIGSELVRQVLKYRPKALVILELSEFNLYNIELEIEALKQRNIEVTYVLGSVCDEYAVLKSLEENQIEIVFHAAAVKHVPLIEKNVSRALQTNVLGTAVLAASCEKAGVKKMVMISTDKAVNPTSVMGASKRLAERVVIERSASKTDFVIVRFGNVLGSSGSVIPLFKEQIKNGGPVTVTSKNMTRYFMSIPEAVNLVLQASSIGKNGNIMVLHMGKPVNIYHMAQKLIELSGFVPEEDIKIEITGLRPGEKEYEELLTAKEQVNNTIFEKIFISKFVSLGHEPIDIDYVKKLINERDSEKIREYIKNNIPEVMF